MNQRMIQSNRPSEAAEQPTMTPDSEERFRALVEHSCDALALFDTNGTIMYVNPSSTRVLGYAGGEVVGRNTFEIVHPEDRQSMRDFFAELVRKPGGVASAQFRVFRPDGSSQWLEGTGNNLLAESGVGAIVVNFRDITERRLAEQMLRAHAQQQMVVAELGQLALGGKDLAGLMNQAVACVAQTLEVEYCKILELVADGQELLVRAGVGWQGGYGEQAAVAAGTESQAGYTLLSGGPVIVADLGTETRFSEPTLMHHHGVVSGISVIIHGQGQQDRPFGVLSAHTTRQRTFNQDDVNFLQAVANVLATAIERRQAEEERAHLLHREREARLRAEAAQQRLATQHAVSRALVDAAPDAEVTAKVLGAIGENLGWDFGALWVAEPQTVVLRCVNTWHEPSVRADEYESVTRGMTLWAGEGFVGQVFASGEAVWVPDLLKEPDLRRTNAVAKVGWRGAICAPIRGESGVLGVIEFLSRQARQPDEETLQATAVLGNQIGQFIERRRAEELTREVSTPVLPIRERLLLLPVIGVIDAQRAAQLTDRLLNAIRSSRARAVVVDVTGVAMMDSYIADHLVKTVEAARLLGAIVIITGISPDVAQTLVRLEVDLSEITTVGDLQGGIEKAERLLGYQVVRIGNPTGHG